jgi:hypothetical protein
MKIFTFKVILVWKIDNSTRARLLLQQQAHEVSSEIESNCGSQILVNEKLHSRI